MLHYVLYVLAGLTGFGALSTIASIGKPLTPGAGAFVALTSAGWIVILVLAARRLS